MKDDSLFKTIKNGVFDIFYIWRNELKTIFKDQTVITFFIVLPLFYPLVYAYIYTNEVIRDIPTVVVDQSNTKLSREFIRKVNATPDVQFIAHCTDMKEAQEYIKQQKAYGIVVIPSDFSTKLNTNQSTEIKVLCDMSGILYYKGIVMATTKVSLDMNEQIKINHTNNKTYREEKISAYPITYEDVSFYNPANGMASYLIPGVLVLIIQQAILLGICVLSGTNREYNRFHVLIPNNKHYSGTLRIVFGKGMSYYMVCILLALYVVCIVPWMFSLPNIGDTSSITLLIIPYLSACIFFCMTVASFVRDRESGLVMFVFTSIILLFGSGISWPLSNIPDFWRYFFHLFPSTFGIKGYIALNSMGASINDISYEYKGLWIQTGVYFLVTCFIYRNQIISFRRRLIREHKAVKERRLNKTE